MHTHIHTYNMHVCVCACVHVCDINMQTHMLTHTHMHTHMHTCTHTCTHMHTLSSTYYISDLKQITPEKLRDILTTVGIRLTPHHMSELLQRMGVKDGCLVDYKAFTNRFMSRSQDGLVHKLISDPTKG